MAVLDSPRERTRGHLALVVVQFCFGLFPMMGRVAMEDFAPFSIASWRVLFGGTVLLVLGLVVHGRRMWVGWRELPMLFVLALLGVMLNQALFLEGLARSTSTNAGLVMCLIPVFTFVLAALLRQETLKPLRIFGVLLSLTGGLVWFRAEDPELVDQYLLGNLMMAGNAFCYAGYLVLSKPVARRHPPLVILGWIYVLSLVSLPLLMRDAPLVPPEVGSNTALALLAILAFPTFLGYLLNLFALERLRASTTAIYIYLQPLVAATAGFLVLDERPTPATGAAAALIFSGIWLVARRPRAKGRALPEASASR